MYELFYAGPSTTSIPPFVLDQSRFLSFIFWRLLVTHPWSYGFHPYALDTQSPPVDSLLLPSILCLSQARPSHTISRVRGLASPLFLREALSDFVQPPPPSRTSILRSDDKCPRLSWQCSVSITITILARSWLFSFYTLSPSISESQTSSHRLASEDLSPGAFALWPQCLSR